MPSDSFTLPENWQGGSYGPSIAASRRDDDRLELVVYADPPREDAYRLVWRHLYARGLEPHVYSETQAEALRATLDRTTQEAITLL
jgi:hypothetical protein